VRAGSAALDGLLDRALVEVERDHLVLGVAPDAAHHVPAHPAEPYEAQLLCHVGLLDPALLLIAALRRRSSRAGSPSRGTRSAGSPSSRSVLRSPIACAFFSVVKPYAAPGISTSKGSSWSSCRKRPVFGPPLWNCPVECKKRGP